MSLEKKPRRPLVAWALPAFFVAVGTWYIAEWAMTPPHTPTFRVLLGVVLLLYGGVRLINLRRFLRSG
ncbi:MAG: hypothetical protein NZ585_10430 [Chloracidobacterium sp.]|nr:hypothetical protein [Chloracidobacterium sp.]MDW8217772.1 hypothetical protein [Acidobacteriota bacterium]